MPLSTETYLYGTGWVSLVDGLAPGAGGGDPGGGGNLGIGPLGTTPLGA